MTIKIDATKTLRPGLLVSLKTSVSGNVQYTKREIEANTLKKDGSLEAKWETERVIFDPQEHEASVKVRSRARQLIRSVCTDSAFGLLCPETSSKLLDDAIAEARAMAEDFNKGASLSRVYVYIITGRIASDDAEAVKAINSEVRELLEDMEKGVKNLDVKVIRDAATRTKGLGAMLTADAQARIQVAIDAARSAARRIVAAGETAAQEVDKVTIKTLREQRTAFLDMDEPAAPAPKTKVKAGSRAVDLEPVKASTKAKSKGRAIDLAPVDKDGVRSKFAKQAKLREQLEELEAGE